MDELTTYHRLSAENSALILGADVFDHVARADYLEMFLADQGHELVFAMMGGTVIGFASGTVVLHPDKAPGLFINEVGVEPEYQRQGIASALCKMLVELAREKGCQGAWVATEADNDPARGLYRSLVGRETEAVVVYDWGDASEE